MNKSEITGAIYCNQNQLNRDDVIAAVRLIVDEMCHRLGNGDRIEIRGFGGLSLRTHRPRCGRNPKTGSTIELDERYIAHFKAGKELRNRVNASRKFHSEAGTTNRIESES